MKKSLCVLLACFLILLAWLIFSAFQPAIIVGESEHWKATYKPRKGDEADSIAYPWNGKIKWRHMFSEPEITSVDFLIDGKYVNNLSRSEAKKNNGVFDGKTLVDHETFYDGPDKSIQGMKIKWIKDGKNYTESFKFERKKSLFIFPLF